MFKELKPFLLGLGIALACASQARADVAFDAATEFSAGTTTRAVSHTPVGTPAGAWVLMNVIGGLDELGACDYGGVNMPEQAGSPVVKTTGETGTVHVYFLGAGIPTGAQTVTCVATGTTLTKSGYVYTVTSAGPNTEVVDVDCSISSDSLDDPSVTLSVSGRTSTAAIAMVSGIDATANVSADTGWTVFDENGIGGTQVAASYRLTTPQATDIAAGYLTSAADDAVMCALAVSEVVAGTSLTCRFLTLLGVTACR